MTLKKIFMALTLPTLFAITSYGQTTLTIQKDFVEIIPPKRGSEEWYPLNHSQNEFGVAITNGKLDIKKVKQMSISELKISGGHLIGVDRGEWGGQLTFKPTNTAKKSIDIKKGNIKFIFAFKDKIYFIEGLAHLSMSEGALYQLDTVNNNFKFTKLLEFDDAPEAFTIYNDKFLIATHKNFYIVQDFKKQLVFKETFWGSLYPNSIAALDDKNIFIGIRSGIVKLDLTDKTLKFYKNDK